MERRLEQDDDDWGLPDDDVLEELSPLLDARQHGLFQRIDRRRAAYFADIEGDQDGNLDEGNGENGEEKGQGNMDGRAVTGSSKPLPSSGFADLSTWCCDAFLPARSRLEPLEERSTRMASIADQPTMVLSLLAPTSVDIADQPTMPMRGRVSDANANYRSPGVSLFFSARGKRRMWDALVRLWRRFMNACSARGRTIRARQSRPPVSKGHELLMERLRERQQGGALARTRFTPGERRFQQIRLPADRSFS